MKTKTVLIVGAAVAAGLYFMARAHAGAANGNPGGSAAKGTTTPTGSPIAIDPWNTLPTAIPGGAPSA